MDKGSVSYSEKQRKTACGQLVRDSKSLAREWSRMGMEEKQKAHWDRVL